VEETTTDQWAIFRFLLAAMTENFLVPGEAFSALSLSLSLSLFFHPLSLFLLLLLSLFSSPFSSLVLSQSPVSGDYLIMDRARVHYGQEMFPLLELLLATREVTLVFLPAYSPELNPCELVNDQLKAYVHRHARSDVVWVWIAAALSRLSYLGVTNMYNHCLDIALYPDT